MTVGVPSDRAEASPQLSRLRLLAALWAVAALVGGAELLLLAWARPTSLEHGLDRWGLLALLLGPVLLAGEALRRLDPLRRRLLRPDPPPPSPSALRDACRVVRWSGAVAAVPAVWTTLGWLRRVTESDEQARWSTLALLAGVVLAGWSLASGLAVRVVLPWWRSAAGCEHAYPGSCSPGRLAPSIPPGFVAAVGCLLGLGWSPQTLVGRSPLWLLAVPALGGLLEAVLLVVVGRRASRKRGVPGEWPLTPSAAEGEAAGSDEAGAADDDWRRARLEAIAFMSHDLRSPLNALLGFSELLLRGPLQDGLTAGHRENLAAVDGAARELLVRVDALLEGVGGRLRSRRARDDWVVLSELVNEVARRLRRRLPAGAAEVRVEVGAGLAPAWTDGALLRGALVLAGWTLLLEAGRPEELRGRPALLLRARRVGGASWLEMTLEPARPADAASLLGAVRPLLDWVLAAAGCRAEPTPEGGLRLGPLVEDAEPRGTHPRRAKAGVSRPSERRNGRSPRRR